MFPEDWPLEVVATEPADAAPRGQSVGVERDRSARTDRGILFVPPAVGVRRRHLDRGNRDEGGKGRWSGETELALSAAPCNRERGPAGKERDVRAEPGSEVQQLMAWDRVARERIHRMQRRGAVTRAATESGPNGNTLGERDRYSEPVARRVEHGSRRSHGKIFIGRPEIRSVDLERYAGVGATDVQLVGELEQRKRGFDLMKSCCLPSENPEKEVDLRIRRDANGIRHVACGAALRSRSPRCRRESDQRPSKVIGRNVVR